MGTLLDLFIVPGAAIWLALGVILAMLFHWLAPAGTDTGSAAAWFIGVSWALGMMWSAIYSERRK